MGWGSVYGRCVCGRQPRKGERERKLSKRNKKSNKINRKILITIFTRKVKPLYLFYCQWLAFYDAWHITKFVVTSKLIIIYWSGELKLKFKVIMLFHVNFNVPSYVSLRRGRGIQLCVTCPAVVCQHPPPNSLHSPWSWRQRLNWVSLGFAEAVLSSWAWGLWTSTFALCP